MTQMAQYVDAGYADVVDYESLGVAEGRSWEADGVLVTQLVLQTTSTQTSGVQTSLM